MLAVVKTPHTNIRIKGRIPPKLIDLLQDEYGKAVQITPEADDEKVDAFQTDWYKSIKKELTPGTYMKVFRQNKRMTQDDLGKALGGFPRQHISNMENGSRPISKKTAIKLAKLFDVSVSKFIG
jgi:DNA-binding XRE family transcriptional regulator